MADPRPIPHQSVSRYEEVCRRRGILPKFARPAREACLQEDAEFDLSNLGLGDAQFCALLQDRMLVPASRIKLWRLRDIRIQAAGAEALAAVVEESTEILDVSRNEIGRKGTEALSIPMVENRLPRLRWLDLSRNSLRSDAVADLATALLNCEILLRLELNHNVIQDGKGLGTLVSQHPCLTRLSLHCNYLSGRGICALFDGVLQNSRAGLRLADVDVAWNGAGDSDALSGAQAIASVLEESVVLYHLDLSYNSFGVDCCAAIGKGLRDNHHLYGLHMVGNAAIVDTDGFLSPLESGRALKSLGSVTSPSTRSKGALARFGDPLNSVNGAVGCAWQRSPSRESSAGSQSSKVQETSKAIWSDDALLRERDVLEQRTTCWACEGWQRIEIEWPLVEGEAEPRAVWVFTSLDDFKVGLRLRRVAGASKFSVARMVPPATAPILVIFQVDSALRTPAGMASVQVEDHGMQPVDIELRACEELPELQPPSDQEVLVHEQKKSSKGVLEHHVVLRSMKACIFDKKGMVSPPSSGGLAGQRTVLLDPPEGSAVPVQMPRVTEREFKFKTKLRRPKSFWSGFKGDTDQVLQACMTMDWSRAKVGRLIKDPDERAAVSQLVRKHYKGLLSVYRHLSAMGVAGDTAFGVTQLEAGEALMEAGCVDNVTKISDVDRFFIASKVLPIEMKKSDFSVDTGKVMTRHQFLELILRVAEQRYLQKGNATSLADAVEQMFSSLSAMCEARATEQDQFLEALHTEAVDDVYRRHHSTLRTAYERFSGNLTPPGLPNFMALTEFQHLLEGIGAYDEKFQSRWSACAFRMGMMTQADECLSSRFQEMAFIEFQHALGAVVFLRSGFAPSRMPALLDDFFSHNVTLALRRHNGSPEPVERGTGAFGPAASRAASRAVSGSLELQTGNLAVSSAASGSPELQAGSLLGSPQPSMRSLQKDPSGASVRNSP